MTDHGTGGRLEMTMPKLPIRACRIAILALLLAGSIASQAADKRIVSRVFRIDEVERIDGKFGIQTIISFGDAEKIENVAVGDGSKWQITPNKRADLLFLKPLIANARTNMTVVTDKRTYFFDLVASPTADPIYMLRFTSEPGVAGADQAEPGSGNAMHQATACNDPAMLNFAWQTEGKAKLAPLQIYDDGMSTYLLWPTGRAVPEMQVRDAGGELVPARSTMRGNTVVVAGVPDTIFLSEDKDKARLVNLNLPELAAPPDPAA